MDYYGYAFTIYVLITHAPFYTRCIGTGGGGGLDRDILLSPNKINHNPGKIMYYLPRNETIAAATEANNASVNDGAAVQPTKVPWEEALRYTMHLALRDRSRNSSTQNLRDIFKANYISHDHREIPQFGDIITLARGKLERNDANGELYLVQTTDTATNCDRLLCNVADAAAVDVDHLKSAPSNKNVTALWLVEKIRHRDQNRGHRYEIKITIVPINNERIEEINNSGTTTDGGFKRRMGKELRQNFSNNRRSFILRDVDYPRYFAPFMNPPAPATVPIRPPSPHKRPIDRSILDFADSNLRSQLNHVAVNYEPELNLGEYYVQPNVKFPDHRSSSMVPNFGYTSRPRYSTQLFPPSYNHQFSSDTTNNFKFPDATSGFANKILTAVEPTSYNQVASTPVTTHFHHHYYVHKHKTQPILKAPITEIKSHHQFYGDHRGNVDVPVGAYKFQVPPLQYPQSAPIYKQPHKSEYNSYQTPQIFTNQIPIPPQFGSQIYAPNTIPYFTSAQYHKTQPSTTAQYTQTLQIPPFAPMLTSRPAIKYLAQAPEGLSAYRTQERAILTTTSAPFHESEQLENSKYSDPDPLYHPQGINPSVLTYLDGNNGNNNDNEEEYKHSLQTPHQQTEPMPTSYNQLLPEPESTPPLNDYEIQDTDYPQVQLHIRDHPSTHRPDSKYPDSINAQLPPPDEGSDVEVPYVETSVITEKSVSPPLIIVPAISATTAENKSTSPPTKKPQLRSSRPIRQRSTTTTTEKPILKWMPKRSRFKNLNISPTASATRNKPTKIYSSKIPQFDSAKVESYITVSPSTPTTSPITRSDNIIEPHTQKSLTSSVSVKVANKRHQLFQNIRPKLKLRSSSSKYEMVKADIQAIHTNSTGMQLFRASDDSDGDKLIMENREIADEEISMDPIALSILKHAKSVTRTSSKKK